MHQPSLHLQHQHQQLLNQGQHSQLEQQQPTHQLHQLGWHMQLEQTNLMLPHTCHLFQLQQLHDVDLTTLLHMLHPLAHLVG
jgi:hypothetical protein